MLFRGDVSACVSAWLILQVVATGLLVEADEAADLHSFSVAEVKPHFGCTSADGQARVQKFINGLMERGTGIIALLELEFKLEKPKGYSAFGGACGRYVDPAALLVDDAKFKVISTIGATVSTFKEIPYIGGGETPANATSMCTSDPNVTWFGKIVGGRPYAGAVLLHMATGKEVCVVTGTFAHCEYTWTAQFVADLTNSCSGRQLLFIVDSNAGCDRPGNVKDSRSLPMSQILANQGVLKSWGSCHDPGPYTEPTCCNDFPDFPYPRWWYDRTAICGGGRVENFQVESAFVCKDSRAEHLFTTATVHLDETGDSSSNESPQCQDHPKCAQMGLDPDTAFTQLLPVDGLCCPTSTANDNLPCCA